MDWAYPLPRGDRKRGRSVRKKWVIIGILSALLIAAVCFLPRPSRINERMSGAIITEEGEIIRDVRFIVDGWKLEYLFREERIEADITFSIDGRKPFLSHAHTGGLLFHAPPSCYLTGYSAYQTEKNKPVGGYFAITSDYDRCILTNVSSQKGYMVGATAPDVGVDDILKTFEGILS